MATADPATWPEHLASLASDRGLARDEVHWLVLAGTPSREALSMASRALPGLRGILLLDATPEGRQRLARHPPCWSGTIRDCDLRFASVARGGQSPVDRQHWVSAANALLANRAVFAHTVVMGGGPADASREWIERHGSRFFAQLAEATDAGSVEPAWLCRLADAAFEQQQYLVALNAYLAANRRQPRPALARQIAATWHALECPRRALEWIQRSALPGHLFHTVVGQLEREVELQDEGEQELERANLEHLAREFPELGEQLQGLEAGSFEVAWLRSYPWMLGGRDSTWHVERQDYPVLLDVHAGYARALNLPRPPSQVRAAIDSVRSPSSAHVMVGSATSLDVLLNVLRHPVETPTPGWAQQVYVAQQDLLALRRLMQVCDLSPLLVSTRIGLEWGPHAEQRLAQRFAEHPRLVLPEIRFAVSPSLMAQLQRVESGRREQLEAAIETIEARHDRSRLRVTLGKLRRGEPLRVWATTGPCPTATRTVVRDLFAALRQQGHLCDRLDEPDPGEDVGPLMAPSIAAFDPDVIVTADGLRTQLPTRLPAALPCVAILGDASAARFTPATVAALGPYDLTFLTSQELAAEYRQHGYPRAVSLPDAAGRTDDLPARSRTAAGVPDGGWETAWAWGTALQFELRRVLEAELVGPALFSVAAGRGGRA
ncbi:MAG: hypothetical protein B7733_02740 [Myxococcales bacterium FL481]|nr:MAG: hypothetical protein B7733_02740 [Myxococcales bacterium FL481]